MPSTLGFGPWWQGRQEWYVPAISLAQAQALALQKALPACAADAPATADEQPRPATAATTAAPRAASSSAIEGALHSSCP